ncbi:peroxiredoxin family protein [Aliikangiella sp. IMCC44359]|uniref:peroxiredoxin family protein n=1 Tax=Aliikangiella sp. IMCC44359 TaxID=3459125 RepID=UPI00403B25D6
MKKIDFYTPLLILCLSLSLVVKADEDEPTEGQIAPDFEITQMDGSKFKLSELKGKKPVYLVFWNTWCTYCMKKIPKLKDAQNNLFNDIQIIAINTSRKDSIEKSLKFRKQFEINYPLAFDHDKKITDLYGVWGTPTEFIIDINGIIQHRDGVPDDLRQHLAQWSKLTKNTQITVSTSQNCGEEKQTC